MKQCHFREPDRTLIEGFQGARSRLWGFACRLASHEKAQDMVEYALLAGFIAIAAAAILPNIADSVSRIFSKMTSLTSEASAQ